MKKLIIIWLIILSFFVVMNDIRYDTKSIKRDITAFDYIKTNSEQINFLLKLESENENKN